MPLPRHPRLIGPVQQMILAALIRTGPHSTASQLQLWIAVDGGVWLPAQQIHTAIHRLALGGYVWSWSRLPAGRYLPWWTRPGPVHPRAARRFVTVTTRGLRALRLATQPADRLRHGLPGFGHEDRLYRRIRPGRCPPTARELAADARRAAGKARRRAALYRRR
jgi:hypothetical protein